jgi:hypothetical protein
VSSVKPLDIESLVQHYVTRYQRSKLTLFSIIPQDSSQELRSALEEKARRNGGSGAAKGKRKFKRGQAKSLSDLPKLNT